MQLHLSEVCHQNPPRRAVAHGAFLCLCGDNTPLNPMKKTILSTLVAVALIGFYSLHADTFGTGANQFTLDFTTIGNTGNAADSTDYGAVGYTYAIGTYDISQNQLNAAAANGLQGVAGGAWSGDQPAANVSWFQAAAYVNWLDTSTGHHASYNLTYSGGAYTMALWQSGQDGYDSSNPFRNSLALYVLPSENEWYKAAYGLSNGSGYTLYATASDSAPTAVASGTTVGTAVYSGDASAPSSVYAAGGLSSYGTMGQGGNVWQWLEGPFVTSSPYGDQLIRGGSFETEATWMQSSARVPLNPLRQWKSDGFRVASVGAAPEPSTYALFGIGALALVIAYRRKVA